MQLKALFVAAGLAGLASASPKPSVNKEYQITENNIKYNVFEHAATNTQLKFVNNSGLCETTPGVNQVSGYLQTADQNNFWFWFFESRKNADTAPLVLWLNGGPGCSSMIGLFQEHGPCTFNDGSSEPKLNPYSWNNVANMLYVDQPVGAGFSYGDNNVAYTQDAAADVWNLVQAFYDQFPNYKSRDFGLFTESYGGHYGPEFAYYFEQQNAAIDAGTLSGTKVNLIALGINNGWIDPVNQYEAYIQFALTNKYRPLIDQSTADQLTQTWKDKCVPAYKGCTSDVNDASNQACNHGGSVCSRYVESQINENFDPYDIRADSDTYPPGNYATWLNSDSVKNAIGAVGQYTECGGSNIGGDDSSRSFITELQSVVNSGINTLMWAGDADWICNWIGNFDAANTIGGSDFASQQVQPFTVSGKQYGEFKTKNNLNWLRVYAAGHEVPAYQPEAALAAFTAIISKQPLSSS